MGTLRVSTPVLSDTLDQGTDGTRRPVLQVRRAFATDATLFCQYAVYGAAKDEAGSLMPRVSAGYEIRRADGVVFKRTNPTPINPTSVGALLRLNGIALRGASPGQYELVLTVKDELAGRSVEVREPFEIVGRVGGALARPDPAAARRLRPRPPEELSPVATMLSRGRPRSFGRSRESDPQSGHPRARPVEGPRDDRL